MTNIYVLDINGKPLMPCHNGAFVRCKLKNKEAKVVRRKPFTVQLMYEAKNNYTQDIYLGVDAGYKYIGFSTSTSSQELFSGELEQDCGMVERNKERRMYRQQRRSRLRYRKARWNNRVATKHKGWLAPSLKRKKETHLRFIMMLNSIMPITHINVEIGLFNPTLMKAKLEGKTIGGKEYQQGEAQGFENMKSYIRYRDNYTCQNPNCKCHHLPKDKKDKLRLFVHHIGYYKNDRTNRPGNLITLCEMSHTPENHQEGHLLYGWKPKVKPLKEIAFMNIVRQEIVDTLKVIYPNKCVRYTYGYKTNLTRQDWHVEKSHHDDAFCIAGQYSLKRAETIYFKQQRRNNRSLEIFHDAKYIDSRDGKRKTGKELYCGRNTRNKNFNKENLHQYRSQKVSKGKRNIRKQHYMYQPNDIVVFEKQKYKIKGSHCKGSRVILDTKKSVSVKKIHILKHCGGIY